MAFSGLRIDVISELQIKDCPDLAIGSSSVQFTRIPAKIIWSSRIWRSPRRFCSYLCEQGCDYLKSYLDDRMRTQKLTPASKIIENTGGLEISRQIKKAIVRAGLNWKPYSLRYYFDVELMQAFMELHLPDDYRKFFMGYVNRDEMNLTPDARRLPPAVETHMRQSYEMAAQRYLTTP